jgi:hypothetical protein
MRAVVCEDSPFFTRFAHETLTHELLEKEKVQAADYSYSQALSFEFEILLVAGGCCYTHNMPYVCNGFYPKAWL